MGRGPGLWRGRRGAGGRGAAAEPEGRRGGRRGGEAEGHSPGGRRQQRRGACARCRRCGEGGGAPRQVRPPGARALVSGARGGEGGGSRRPRQPGASAAAKRRPGEPGPVRCRHRPGAGARVPGGQQGGAWRAAGRMTGLAPLAGWASGQGLPTAPLTRRHASRSRGGLGAYAPGLAGRRGMASSTLLSFRPSGAFSSQTATWGLVRAGHGKAVDGSSEWELADTDRANRIIKDKLPPGWVRTSSHLLVDQRPRALEDLVTVKLRRFLRCTLKKKKFFIVVHSFLLRRRL